MMACLFNKSRTLFSQPPQITLIPYHLHLISDQCTSFLDCPTKNKNAFYFLFFLFFDFSQVVNLF